MKLVLHLTSASIFIWELKRRYHYHISYDLIIICIIIPLNELFNPPLALCITLTYNAICIFYLKLNTQSLFLHGLWNILLRHLLGKYVNDYDAQFERNVMVSALSELKYTLISLVVLTTVKIILSKQKFEFERFTR